MKDLQDRCVWKEMAETHIVADGNMKKCKKCNGYNATCDTYFINKEKETKLRIYKTK